MRNLPEPGIESVSPALAGGLLAPGPLGKSLSFLITHSTEGSTAVLSLQFLLSLKSQGDGAAYSMSALYTQWVCCTAAETHAKEPWSSKGDFRQTCPSFAMEGDMVFTVLVGNLPCASEGDTISIFWGCFLYKHPWKERREQKLTQGIHEWERPKKNGLPIPLHYLIYIMIGSLVINSHKTVIFSW